MNLSCAYCKKTLTNNLTPCTKCELVYYCDWKHRRLDEDNHLKVCGKEYYNRNAPSSSHKGPSLFDNNDESDSKLIIDRDEKLYVVRSNRLTPNMYVEIFRAILEKNKKLLSNFTFDETPEGMAKLSEFGEMLFNPYTNSRFKSSLELFELSNKWRIYNMMYKRKEDDDRKDYLKEYKEREILNRKPPVFDKTPL
jgi:hypothetical protein